MKSTGDRRHRQSYAVTTGLPEHTSVIVSEAVTIVAEARAFILRGHVCSVGVYEGDVDVDAAREFLQDVASGLELLTCVLDAALTEDRGWIVVEANATWGAGLNGCDATKVVDCIDVATSVAA